MLLQFCLDKKSFYKIWNEKDVDKKVTEIFANDKGAIDPVIKSRVQTAVYRSAKSNNYKWI